VQQSAESVLQPKQGSVTILFADIAGFTQMTENMSTEEVVQLTRRVLSLLTQAVYEQGGTLDKYMGDALMAFWNAPVPQPQHRRLAIQAGLSMRHALQSLNDVRHALGLAPIRVRIGINTGDVLVGDLGTEWRHAYTVMGDAVNVAQRLTEVADALASDMVIGANTAATLAAIIPDLQPKGEVVLSGKHQPVSVFVIPVTKLDRYLRQNVA
jgi:adenylate cyclase